MRQLPILRVRKAGKEVLTFKPYGLWVIGANGRIDLFGRDGSYFLVDRATGFQPPQWHVFGSSDRKLQGRRLAEGIDFTEDTFGSLLRG